MGIRANRITFDKVKRNWEQEKMVRAYIEAERRIIEDASKGVDLTGYSTTTTFLPMDAETFHYQVDGFGNIKHESEKEGLYKKAQVIRQQVNDAIAEEDYERAEVLEKLLRVIKDKYDKL